MVDLESNVIDINIIGGGPAGLYGTYYAGLRGSSVRIIESLPQLGGRLMALYPEKYVYDVAGFPKILAKELVANLSEQALQHKPLIALEEKVIALESFDEGKIFKLTTDKNNEYKSKTVIIAAGVGAFVPRKLDVKGMDTLEGRGIFYFVRDLNIFNDKRVVIVGGGDSAVDWALNLEKSAREVTVLHRLGRFQAHEDSVDKLLNSSVNVNFPYYELKEIHGEEKVEAVTFFNNKTGEEHFLETDALLLNIGFLANLGPISKWGLEIEKNSIKVNFNMETNLSGIYAAGDIVTHPGKIKLISTGAGEAAIAVNVAKHYIDPMAKVEPGHSSHPKKAKKAVQPTSDEPKKETGLRKIFTAQSFSGYEIIKIAMEEEKDGIEFYKSLLEKNFSPKVKDTFSHLLFEEEKHLETFKNNLLPSFDRGEIDLEDEDMVVTYLKRLKKSGIFQAGEEIEQIKEDLATEAEAIVIGLDIERKSIAYYKKVSESMPESEGKEAIKKLISEEEEHVKILRKLQADILVPK